MQDGDGGRLQSAAQTVRELFKNIVCRFEFNCLRNGPLRYVFSYVGIRPGRFLDHDLLELFQANRGRSNGRS